VRSPEKEREDRMKKKKKKKKRDLRSQINRKKIGEGEKMREMSRRVRETH
jgi:hypothetical protein